MCWRHEQLPNVIGVGPQWATANVRQKATVVREVRGSRSNKRLVYESSSRMLCYVNGKCRFVERIDARNLSTAATPPMRYTCPNFATSLYAVLKLSIFKTMNACNGVVERPADDSWLTAGNV